MKAQLCPTPNHWHAAALLLTWSLTDVLKWLLRKRIFGRTLRCHLMPFSRKITDENIIYKCIYVDAFRTYLPELCVILCFKVIDSVSPCVIKNRAFDYYTYPGTKCPRLPYQRRSIPAKYMFGSGYMITQLGRGTSESPGITLKIKLRNPNQAECQRSK